MLWLSPNARVAVGAGGAVLGACSSRVSEYVVGAYLVHMHGLQQHRAAVTEGLCLVPGAPRGEMAVEPYPGMPGGYGAGRQMRPLFPCFGGKPEYCAEYCERLRVKHSAQSSG